MADADGKLLALQAEYDAAWAKLECANAVLAVAETRLDEAGIMAAAKLQSEAIDHLHKIEKHICKAPAHSPHSLALKARIATKKRRELGRSRARPRGAGTRG